MKWHDVQTAAKARNHLVFAMDQGQQIAVLRNTRAPERDGGIAVNGYCMGLAIHWMEQMYAGRNLPFNTLTQTYEEIDWRAFGVYEAYLKLPKEGETFRWHGAAKVLRMSANRGLRGERWLQPANGKFLCETIGRAWGCYGILLVPEKAGQATHAIAARHAPDNTFHLFDPNRGHFTVKWLAKFEEFVDWYMQKTNYAATYSNGCFVIGIKPPMGA